MKRFLGVDTSNYATSLAVYEAEAAGEIPNGRPAVMLKRFLPVKAGGLGLRQSDAVFHHTAALPGMLNELRDKAELKGLSAVGVSVRPRPVKGSYMPCFLVGQSVAAAVAAALDIPVVETSHQQGHIAAALYASGQPLLGRALVFHVSGGTTELLLADRLQVAGQLGGTLDLYAGQAVDRLGVRLGYSFPAGEQLSRLAAGCPEEIDPKVTVKGTSCCLSGLQNQCERLLAEGRAPAYAAKYCLTAIAKTLCRMLEAARAAHPQLPCICAGGVMGSEIIRSYMSGRVQGIFFVPGSFSSDNALGPALIAAAQRGGG